MSTLFKTIFIAFSLFLAASVAWNLTFPSGSWRYRMTVTVETPEGLKSGSAVREVTVHTGWSLFPEMHSAVELKGQAVVLDLGQRGRLFAIMRSPKLGEDYGDAIVPAAFPSKCGGYKKGCIKYYSQLKSPETTLPPDLYPYLVSFKNIKDATTVELVLGMSKKPGENNLSGPYVIDEDHMSEIFGAGVRLKSITVVMTDEPVTELSRDNFPEFGEGYMDWYSHLQYRDPRRIHAAVLLKD